MNKKTKLLFYLIFIIGCSSIVDEDSLIEKDTLKYSNNSSSPFTGEVVGKYTSGEDRVRGNYKDGKREGRWVFLHKNGKDSEKGEYINGNRYSEWNKWYDNGILERLDKYDRFGGRQLGWTTRWKNGNMRGTKTVSYTHLTLPTKA